MSRTLLLVAGWILSVALLAQDRLGDLRDRGDGFAQVTPGKTLKFPRDHGAHPDYRIEWWYLTANLTDSDGRHWGTQWTLFRQALSPRPIEAGWHSNQVWLAHAAITTPEGHFHEQRFARGGIGQAGVVSLEQGKFFDAWMDDWQWRSEGAALFPARLKFTVGTRQVTLSLSAEHDPVANGPGGYSQKSEQGQASYYYSQPDIRVRGSVVSGRDKVQLSGVGWLDREWSSQALAENQQGWDWFSLHLDDGHKLMVYQLRHVDSAHWKSGSWIDPAGRSTLLEPDTISLQSMQSREITTSEHRVKLPLEWRLSLTEQQRSWRIRPLYDQQWMATLFPYWEGVVLVEDETGKPSGVGYMELTGYQ